MCLLRRPLCLDPIDFIRKFKISKPQFVIWVTSCMPCVSRNRELDYMAQGLLFIHKILNNASFASLAVDFVITPCAAKKIFMNVLLHQYQNNVNIPRILFDSCTVDDQIEHLYRESSESTPPLIHHIYRHFVDPSGRDRIPVILLLDATYLSVQDLTDIYLHKSLFYGPKKDHVVKLLCFSNCVGKIVGVLPLACSQSPTCGDSFLVGHFIEMEESAGGTQYFRTLLRGNNRYWVILVTDAGLVTRPSRAGVQVIGLQDVCDQEGCLLLHTKSEEYLLDRDVSSGKISKVPQDPQLLTRKAHTAVVSRLVRNINEQAHGGLKQKVKILGSSKIPRQFLFPVGPNLGRKFGLPQEHHQFSRLSIVATVGIGLYNFIHPGFQIRFLNHNSQIALSQIYCSRLNLENPLDYGLAWNCRLDRNSGRGFVSITVQDVINSNIVDFPQLPEDLFNPLVYDITGGPASLIGACSILSYMSFKNIRENNPNFTVRQVQSAVSLPFDTTLQYFSQVSEPDGWQSDIFGQFIPCKLVRMKCPPTYKSESDPANWKFAVIAYADIEDQRLSIRGPLSRVLFWYCFGCPSAMGLMRTCKHVTALLMVLSCRYAFTPKTLSVCLLNPKAACGTQTTRILPETNAGGWTDNSLGSQRITRDTRHNHLYYSEGSSNMPNSGTNISVDANGLHRSANFQVEHSVLVRTSIQTSPVVTDRARILNNICVSSFGDHSNIPVSFTQVHNSPVLNDSQSGINSNIRASSNPEVTDTSIAQAGVEARTGQDGPPGITRVPSVGSGDNDLQAVLSVVDPMQIHSFPLQTSYVKGQCFTVSELQQVGLLNSDKKSCYMNSVILLFHRIRVLDSLLDNAYCSFVVTRNRPRSLITKLFRHVLQALPSGYAFSLRNLISGWTHIQLQPVVQLGVFEDAQEVLAALLNGLLMKVSRAEVRPFFTKFQGQLTCRNTRDCVNFEYADSFEGQIDPTPLMHVIGIDANSGPVIKLKEKLYEFMTGIFNSRCKAIMCGRRISNCQISVTPGKYTIVTVNRNADDNAKHLQKIDLSAYDPLVDNITQEPIVVVSHAGSLRSGHYFVYSRVNDEWHLNDDDKRILQCGPFSPFDHPYHEEETADIVVFENKV